uniref:Protein F37C4.5 n=1 Tax=Rhizochromulina marina TaxID=1034831 RepID=A0A7S2SQQ5_9STRA|mmetsp:Transcript_4491/g.13445  ORF Transcript_4491/g.13445 Transcript_4491/m.13445 type:complete len:666 (+) Transcript_4491:45-2042(+)|eukprot:CAMPEP_0118964758 /NCGR_PEP_ID=MMETSP1173-20130426/2393_1 /TAXON_ID=1034831 /ORGANISM="Rhizochromulina marina cf, Strain CCMP1243" /LENGTH=665 /DNA_ID=CAMNT_0006913253 /DNA_START=45 /DNA_END=2042 /DNA_ORIENTATION=-
MASEEQEVKEVELELEECLVSDVQVFLDRAEVTRVIEFTPLSAGAHTLVVKGLTDKADTDSIRVKGFQDKEPRAASAEAAEEGSEQPVDAPPPPGAGPARGQECVILEVSFDVHFRPVEDGEPGKEGELRSKIKEIAAKKQELDDALRRVKQQDGLVQDYLKSMLVSTASPTAGPGASQAKAPPPVGTDLDTVKQLLAFHSDTASSADNRSRELQEELRGVASELDAARASLEEVAWQRTQRSRPIASRDVTIAVNIPTDPLPGQTIKLRLTYLVKGASWVPTYDIRTSLGAKGEAANMSLTYFGVVQQSTGEDWRNAFISLSTASPASGGSPPMPPTRQVQWAYSARPELQQQQRHVRRGSQRRESRMTNVAMPQQAMMPLQRELSIDALEAFGNATSGGDRGGDSDDEEEADMSFATMATAGVSAGAGGSATFHIDRKSTIASNNKEHKVTVAIIDLTPDIRHFCTPELEERAYIQARATNSSPYPLLESNRVSIFFDGNFITTTTIKHTSPGETITVFLGVDSQVKVEHRLVTKSENTGQDGGVFRRQQQSQQLFEYRTILHNTKLDRAIDITIVQLLPRSTTDKIVVELLKPPRREVPVTGEASGNSAGEGELQSGSVMQNKITNNVVFDKNIAPKGKIEIPFSFSVQWPHDAGTGKVEVV